MVEHQIVALGVVGSIPTGRPKEKALAGRKGFLFGPVAPRGYIPEVMLPDTD